VDAIIEGSVTRFEDRVRITAQLIDAQSDRHLWARTYERDLKDILALQDEVARDIAAEIRIKLTPQEQSRLTCSVLKAHHKIVGIADDYYVAFSHFPAPDISP